jgi:hypothetical protein
MTVVWTYLHGVADEQARPCDIVEAVVQVDHLRLLSVSRYTMSRITYRDDSISISLDLGLCKSSRANRPEYEQANIPTVDTKKSFLLPNLSTKNHMAMATMALRI